MPHVAVVGAGPSGVFAAAELLTRPDVQVDVLDRLPTPFGLVRYGVAPDHLKIKSVVRSLSRVLSDPRVRFHGNVEFGRDVTLADLKETCDAVVFATGAPLARRLGIPGEDLPGSITAADLVPWYNGHPRDGRPWGVAASTVVVVGAGNVALDAARVLLKGGTGLEDTDLPDDVASALDAHPVTDVHIVIRRGVADVKFTPAELMEIERLDLDVVVDPADVVLTGPDAERADTERIVAQRVDILTRWAGRSPRGAPKRLHVHFRRSPTEILGDGRVEAVRLRPTGSAGPDRLLAVDAVVAAVGYRSRPVPGLTGDEQDGALRHMSGRVGPGVYVAGWLKRGPSGVIGTNKQCAVESVRSLFADLDGGRLAEVRAGGLPDLLARNRPAVVDWAGWERIDAAETALGARRGRARTKITDWVELVRIGTGVEPVPDREDVQ